MFEHEVEELVDALEGFIKAVQLSDCDRSLVKFVPEYRERLTRTILNISGRVGIRYSGYDADA